jgi:hypothetical protein
MSDDEALIVSLKEQVATLKHCSEQLAVLAGRLPKHGATVRCLSRALLSGSQFIQAVAVRILRDPTAA